MAAKTSASGQDGKEINKTVLCVDCYITETGHVKTKRYYRAKEEKDVVTKK